MRSRRSEHDSGPSDDSRNNTPVEQPLDNISQHSIDREISASSNSLSPRETFSTLTRPLSLRSRTDRSPRRDSEPLGLHVVYDPSAGHVADIIFVHGLGGTSRLTWSWKKDLSLFWPERWLPLEPGIEQARILTFGYNANFRSPNTGLFDIPEFANDLLVQMKFGNDQNVNSLKLGKVPIIFVAHSMGGLVVKKVRYLSLSVSMFPVRSLIDIVPRHTQWEHTTLTIKI